MGIRQRLHWMRTSEIVIYETPEDVSEDYRRHNEAEDQEEQTVGRSKERVTVWVQHAKRNDSVRLRGLHRDANGDGRTHRRPGGGNMTALEDLLTVKELAYRLRKHRSYVSAMRMAGFIMPGGVASLAEARSWLARNPPPRRRANRSEH